MDGFMRCAALVRIELTVLIDVIGPFNAAELQEVHIPRGSPVKKHSGKPRFFLVYEDENFMKWSRHRVQL
jgi:hypothetical protein